MDTASSMTAEQFAWREDAAAGTFRRPLGNTELGFYWDSIFNGVAIVISNVEFETSAEIASRQNVEGAWLRLKTRFPMLGAFVEERPAAAGGLGETVEFVVDERRLMALQPAEVNFVDAESVSDVELLLHELQNGTPKLSNDLICQMWFVSRKDKPGHYHYIWNAMHYITDGIAGATMNREFCHELARSLLTPSSSSQIPPLRQRLQTLLPMEVLSPGSSFTLPRRRWRIAIAKIIYDNRQARLAGGQTLPTKPQKLAPGEAPISRAIRLELPVDVSDNIMRSCRSLGITFGNALPILSQLGHARVLHRRRFHTSSTFESISAEEWDHRRVQPTHFGGPLNIRPYLDRQWYRNGGGEEICLAISFYFLELPFLPLFPRPQSSNATSRDSFSVPDSGLVDPNEIGELGVRSEPQEHTPPFFAFLTPQRFLHRAQIVKSQSARVFKHPLINEIHLVRSVDRIRRAKAAGLAWRRRLHPVAHSSEEAPIAFNQPNCVFANGGASLGNRDLAVPLEYPLRGRDGVSKTQKPTLREVDYFVDLRVRPSELYLGAVTSHGVLNFFCHVDVNTYDESVVREWMQEVADAAVAYLGKGAMDGFMASRKASAKL